MKHLRVFFSVAIPFAISMLVVGAAQSFDKTPNVDIKVGKQIYMGTCVACHGADGSGTVPGAPNFNKPGGRLSKPDAVLLRHTLKGFRSKGSQMAMPPKGGDPDLTAARAKAVIAYMHKTFGK